MREWGSEATIATETGSDGGCEHWMDLGCTLEDEKNQIEPTEPKGWMAGGGGGGRGRGRGTTGIPGSSQMDGAIHGAVKTQRNISRENGKM